MKGRKHKQSANTSSINASLLALLVAAMYPPTELDKERLQP